MDNINKNFSDIKDAFSILEGQDKLIHLIDLGKKIDKINMEDKKDTNNETQKIVKRLEQVGYKILKNDNLNITFMFNV